MAKLLEKWSTPPVKNMRKTKCFSYGAEESRFWRLLEREARLEKRSLSAQLFFILEDFFSRKKILRLINQPKNEAGKNDAQ